MAFESIKIKIIDDSREVDYGVYDPVYAEKVQFTPKNDWSGKPPSGRFLEKQKGFSFNMEYPRVDFKILRSMIKCGAGDIARKVISSKRRSYVTGDYIWDNVLNFSKRTQPRFEDRQYYNALKDLEDQFKLKQKLKPIHIDDAFLKIPQSTNPGIPYIYTDPGKKKGEILKMYKKEIKQLWKVIGEGERDIKFSDCAAFARSHIGDPHVNKVRPVWAYPLDVIVGEALFVNPLIDEFKRQEIFVNSAYGMEMMKGGMEWLNSQINRARELDPGCKFIMTDYSSFDSTVPAWVIRDCFSIIKRKFDLDIYHANILRKLESYFINTPIRNCNGLRFLKDHGIPSGSMFTNIIGSMVNFLVSRWVIRKTMLIPPIFDIYFGDDGLICVKDVCVVNFAHMANMVRTHFGLDINVKKSYWTNNTRNIHFLGYYNHDGTPFKTSEDLFASMLYPQYWNDTWAYALARSLGCLMASAGSNRDIYVVTMTVYHWALKAQEADVAFDLIKTHPRMTRHLTSMGVDPNKVSPKILYDNKNCLPITDCEKFEKRINLIRPY